MVDYRQGSVGSGSTDSGNPTILQYGEHSFTEHSDGTGSVTLYYRILTPGRWGRIRVDAIESRIPGRARAYDEPRVVIEKNYPSSMSGFSYDSRVPVNLSPSLNFGSDDRCIDFTEDCEWIDLKVTVFQKKESEPLNFTSLDQIWVAFGFNQFYTLEEFTDLVVQNYGIQEFIDIVNSGALGGGGGVEYEDGPVELIIRVSEKSSKVIPFGEVTDENRPDGRWEVLEAFENFERLPLGRLYDGYSSIPDSGVIVPDAFYGSQDVFNINDARSRSGHKSLTIGNLGNWTHGFGARNIYNRNVVYNSSYGNGYCLVEGWAYLDWSYYSGPWGDSYGGAVFRVNAQPSALDWYFTVGKHPHFDMSERGFGWTNNLRMFMETKVNNPWSLENIIIDTGVDPWDKWIKYSFEADFYNDKFAWRLYSESNVKLFEYTGKFSTLDISSNIPEFETYISGLMSVGFHPGHINKNPNWYPVPPFNTRPIWVDDISVLIGTYLPLIPDLPVEQEIIEGAFDLSRCNFT